MLSLSVICLSVTGSMAFLVDRPGVSRTTFSVGGPGMLASRQTGTNPAPPPQCATVCSAVSNFVGGEQMCTVSTCCISSFVNGFFNCIECVGQAENITDYSAFQTTIDTIVEECATDGVPLQKVTFPGQNPNRTLSTSVGSSTGGLSTNSVTAPGSPIVTTSGGSVQTISQSTITSVPSTTPQVTITSLPTSTPSPSPTSSSASSPYANYGVIFCTVLTVLFVSLF